MHIRNTHTEYVDVFNAGMDKSSNGNVVEWGANSCGTLIIAVY